MSKGFVHEVDRILRTPLADQIASSRTSVATAHVRLSSGDRIAYSLPAQRSDDLFDVVGSPVRADVDRMLIASFGDASIYCDSNHGVVRIGDIGRFVNSSIKFFTEFSWRWHFLVSVLADEQDWAGARDMEIFRETGSVDPGNGPYADYLEGRGLAVDYFSSLDPLALSGEGWWRNIVMEYS